MGDSKDAKPGRKKPGPHKVHEHRHGGKLTLQQKVDNLRPTRGVFIHVLNGHLAYANGKGVITPIDLEAVAKSGGKDFMNFILCDSRKEALEQQARHFQLRKKRFPVTYEEDFSILQLKVGTDAPLLKGARARLQAKLRNESCTHFTQYGALPTFEDLFNYPSLLLKVMYSGFLLKAQDRLARFNGRGGTNGGRRPGADFAPTKDLYLAAKEEYREWTKTVGKEMHNARIERNKRIREAVSKRKKELTAKQQYLKKIEKRKKLLENIKFLD